MNVCIRSSCAFILLSAAVLGDARPVHAQTSRVTPRDGFVFHDERTIDRFAVQRWVSRDAPDISPSGTCECIVLVYEGPRLVFDTGITVGITGVDVVRDVTGDTRAELMITQHSGGAHCCQSTSIYSLEATGRRPLLAIATDNCGGEIVDLDGNGVPEFRTCDDIFAYAFCSFAFSPMPDVVFSFDPRRSEFVLATPSFATYLPPGSVADARRVIDENRDDPQIQRCVALGPALDLIYSGRMAEGQNLFRVLYQGADAADVEQKALALLKKSQRWTPH